MLTGNFPISTSLCREQLNVLCGSSDFAGSTGVPCQQLACENVAPWTDRESWQVGLALAGGRMTAGQGFLTQQIAAPLPGYGFAWRPPLRLASMSASSSRG